MSHPLRLALLLALCAACVNARPCAAAGGDPNEVVCTVNSERIRRGEVEDRMPKAVVNKLAGLRRRLTDMGRTNAEAQETVEGLLLPVFRQTLRGVVRERLMLQEATRQGLRVNKLVASNAFEREWQALEERGMAGTPGYEEKTVRERMYRLLLLQAFRRQPAVSRNEDAWFREALKRSWILGTDGEPVELTFFFPNDRPAKPPAPGAVIDIEEPARP